MKSILLGLALLLARPDGSADRRVVDRVIAGDPASESMHGYAGHAAAAGMSNARPFRETRGWMHYALATFDDSEVTVALEFAGGDSVSRHYDVLVEDSLVASRTLPAGAGAAVVEVDVPFGVTKGKAHVAVVIRARGGVTPALRELRTVQDHNELRPVP